jgi:hypothetical protein
VLVELHNRRELLLLLRNWERFESSVHGSSRGAQSTEQEDEQTQMQWISPAHCRVVSQRMEMRHPEPVDVANLENALAADGTQPPTTAQRHTGASCCGPAIASLYTNAIIGNVATVHHGPCCHWFCNCFLCPCWTSSATVVQRSSRPLVPTMGEAVG